MFVKKKGTTELPRPTAINLRKIFCKGAFSWRTASFNCNKLSCTAIFAFVLVCETWIMDECDIHCYVLYSRAGEKFSTLFSSLAFWLIMFKCRGDFRRQLAPACGATTEEEEGSRQAHQTECWWNWGPEQHEPRYEEITSPVSQIARRVNLLKCSLWDLSMLCSESPSGG